MIDVTKLKPTWLWVIGEEGPPPTIERQIKRMFCLTAMTVRSSCVEVIRANEPRVDEAIDQYNHAATWIKANADDELTVWERKCAYSAPEAWSHRDLIDASWTFQAAAMIGWALGLTSWLPVWTSYGPENFDFVFIESSRDDIKSIAKPRRQKEIELMNSVTCAWLWRCRAGDQSRGMGFIERRKHKKGLAEFVAELGKSGQFDPPINGDFNVGGTPFLKLSKDESNALQSRSNERLRALNWLVGQDPDYDSISCDT